MVTNKREDNKGKILLIVNWGVGFCLGVGPNTVFRIAIKYSVMHTCLDIVLVLNFAVLFSNL